MGEHTRLVNLAERLVASGPKASHVSASECHEIADGVHALIGDIAARDAAIDAFTARVAELIERRDALLVLVRNLSQSTPLPSELEGWEGQRAALLAEVGTLRARVDELERNLIAGSDEPKETP